MVPERCSACGHDGYRSPSLTVDAIATRTTNGKEVLMIKEAIVHQSGKISGHFLGFRGLWGRPTRRGHQGTRRNRHSWLEPCSLQCARSPGRDPRKHCVGLFYTVDVDMETDPLAGDDAVHSEWVRIEDLNRKT